jgi:tripartite-type tricarboxylate transporter receptor subunit TctC
MLTVLGELAEFERSLILSRCNDGRARTARRRAVVCFAAGGVTDIVARLMGQRLSERLGQQFLVENRTGAGTNIATEAVVNAAPDGYTLLLATSSNAINATLYQKLNFNFIRDIAPVAGIVDAPLVMEVHPSIPANTVPEFIAYAEANPGKINLASGGIGSAPHVAGELFKMMANVNLVHVPYRGSAPALTEMIGGQVQVMFDTVPTSIEYIRSGKLRALAATTAMRLDVLPDIPTVGDFLPGFEASAWQGLCAPKSTPPETVRRLNNEINAALSDVKIRAQLEDLGLKGRFPVRRRTTESLSPRTPRSGPRWSNSPGRGPIDEPAINGNLKRLDLPKSSPTLLLAIRIDRCMLSPHFWEIRNEHDEGYGGSRPGGGICGFHGMGAADPACCWHH